MSNINVASLSSANVAGNTVISDTWAHISAALGATGALTKFIANYSNIIISPTQTTLSIPAATFASGYGALSKITSGYTSITVTGTLSASSLTTDIATYGTNLLNKLTAGLAVSDTSSNIASNLDTLQALSAANKLVSVAITDANGKLGFTADQFANDASLLTKITAASTYSFSVSGALAAEQIFSINNALGSKESALLAKLSTPLTISDTAANISTHLNALQTFNAISPFAGINLTDTVTPTPTITVSGAKLANDLPTLNLIQSAFDLQVGTGSIATTNANFNQIKALLASNTNAGIAITDSVANITSTANSTFLTNLASLSNQLQLTVKDSAANLEATGAVTKLNASSLVSNIIVTGTVTESDLVKLAALTKSIDFSSVHVGNALLAAQAVYLTSNGYTGHYIITDTLTNIQSQIVPTTVVQNADAVNISGSVSAANYLTALNWANSTQLTDGAAPSLSLLKINSATAAQLLDPALNKHLTTASGSVTLAAVTNAGDNTVTLAQAAQLEKISALSLANSSNKLTIDDTVAHLLSSNALAVIAKDGGASVSISDSATISLAQEIKLIPLAASLDSGANLTIKDTLANILAKKITINRAA